MARLRHAGAALVLAVACKPYTTRPDFPPVTGAAQTEVELPVRAATRVLADALRRDSLPVTRVVPEDGLLESPWFDARTLRPTGARPLGPAVVRIRAWVDPTRQGFSRLTVETAYRPLADPSLSERELDHQVPLTHPVAVRVAEIVQELARRYGGAEAPAKPDS